MSTRYALVVLLIAFTGICRAQVPADGPDYEAWKLAQVQHPVPHVHPGPVHQGNGNERDGGSCPCWIDPDSTYTLALGPADDASSAAIAIPFQFNLYGSPYSTCYVNNNGNVTFQASYLSFSASGFPVSNFKMLAPFWADVDTYATTDSSATNHGQVWYKVTAHAVYVNWVDVGYYYQHWERKNSFQLIFTDGTASVVPGGNNVSFCYGEMQWTTGDASGGADGFGGIPATVGANKGDGVNYLQLGRFNRDSTNWTGPYSDTSGVAWLSERHFFFSTASANIPPIFTSIGCDTLEIEAGSSMDYPVMMIAGGPGQVITGTSQCLGIANYVETENIPGAVARIISTISPTASEVGIHPIHYTAHNDTIPVATSSYTVYVKVLDVSTGTPDLDASKALSLAPNPSNGHSTLCWPADHAPQRVEVLSVDGKVVLADVPDAGSLQMDINLTGRPEGFYVVRAIDARSARTLRLIKTSLR
jgi:hypothetical protein